MAYRLEGFINGVLPKPSLFHNHDCMAQNLQLGIWIQYDFLVKSWIYSFAALGINFVVIERLLTRDQ